MHARRGRSTGHAQRRDARVEVASTLGAAAAAAATTVGGGSDGAGGGSDGGRRQRRRAGSLTQRRVSTCATRTHGRVTSCLRRSRRAGVGIGACRAGVALEYNTANLALHSARDRSVRADTGRRSIPAPRTASAAQTSVRGGPLAASSSRSDGQWRPNGHSRADSPGPSLTCARTHDGHGGSPSCERVAHVRVLRAARLIFAPQRQWHGGKGQSIRQPSLMHIIMADIMLYSVLSCSAVGAARASIVLPTSSSSPAQMRRCSHSRRTSRTKRRAPCCPGRRCHRTPRRSWTWRRERRERRGRRTWRAGASACSSWMGKEGDRIVGNDSVGERAGWLQRSRACHVSATVT